MWLILFLLFSRDRKDTAALLRECKSLWRDFERERERERERESRRSGVSVAAACVTERDEVFEGEKTPTNCD